MKEKFLKTRKERKERKQLGTMMESKLRKQKKTTRGACKKR